MVDQPSMFAKRLAICVDYLAGAGHVWPPLGDEVGIGTLADEADLLTLSLLRHGQVESPRQRPRLGLVESTEREMDEAELLLGQRVEDVALVLFRVDGAQQTVRLPHRRIAALDPGVVSGSQTIGSDQLGPLHQVAELHMPVALQAGVRGPPRGVLVDETLDDRLAELAFHIDGVKRNPDAGAGHARVV